MVRSSEACVRPQFVGEAGVFKVGGYSVVLILTFDISHFFSQNFVKKQNNSLFTIKLTCCVMDTLEF